MAVVKLQRLSHARKDYLLTTYLLTYMYFYALAIHIYHELSSDCIFRDIHVIGAFKETVIKTQP